MKTKNKKSVKNQKAIIAMPKSAIVEFNTLQRAIENSPVFTPVITPRKKRESVSMISTKDSGQSNVWDFEVEQEQLKTSAGKNSGIHAVIRKDTGEVIGQYRGVKILPYKQLVESFESSLVANGLNFEKTITTTKNGARFFAKYKIAQTTFRKESYNEILTLESSYDGSLRNMIAYSAERLACLNCMTVSEQMFAMMKKHSERFDLNFIASSVMQAIKGGREYMEATLVAMGNIALNDNQVRNILSNIGAMGAKVGASEKAMLFVWHNWTHPTNDEKPLGETMLRLANAVTRYTRDVENVGRLETSRKANIYIVGALDLATRRANDFAKLVNVPTKPIDFDGIVIEV